MTFASRRWLLGSKFRCKCQNTLVSVLFLLWWSKHFFVLWVVFTPQITKASLILSHQAQWSQLLSVVCGTISVLLMYRGLLFQWSEEWKEQECSGDLISGLSVSPLQHRLTSDSFDTFKKNKVCMWMASGVLKRFSVTVGPGGDRGLIHMDLLPRCTFHWSNSGEVDLPTCGSTSLYPLATRAFSKKYFLPCFLLLLFPDVCTSIPASNQINSCPVWATPRGHVESKFLSTTPTTLLVALQKKFCVESRFLDLLVF